MIEDLARYSKSKAFVQRWYRDKGNNDPCGSIAIMSISTSVPCIVVAYWLAEECNWPPEMIERINILMKFYRYVEIQNKPEGCPI